MKIENVIIQNLIFIVYIEIIHDGAYIQTITNYSAEMVNYFALYSSYEDEFYLLKNDGSIREITIRNSPPANNQSKGIHYSENYQIDNILDKLNLTPGIYYDA